MKRAKARRKRLSAEQIATVLRDVQRRVRSGQSIGRACAALGVAQQSYYRWRAHADAPRDSPGAARTRELLLESARRTFLRRGYGASLSEIAADANVARQTIYNQFGGKEQLFRDVVKAIYERVLLPPVLAEPNGDLASVLNAYGRRYLAMALDREMIALQRITVAEHQRHPRLGAISYALRDAHALPTLAEGLTAQLQEEMDKGAIRAVAPDIVSMAFLGAIFGMARQLALADVFRSQDYYEAVLQTSVALFLRGLVVESPPRAPRRRRPRVRA